MLTIYPNKAISYLLSKVSKQAAAAISALLDSMEAAKSGQDKELAELEAKAKQVRCVRPESLQGCSNMNTYSVHN